MAGKPHAKLEAWIWVLIYGGLIALIIGIVVAQTDQTLGWAIGIPGVVVATVGAFLVYLRSRFKD